jgi:hypothetical protein
LHNTRLERLARAKHSSLLGPFMSYEGNKVLWIRPQRLVQNIFLVVIFNYVELKASVFVSDTSVVA